MDWNLKAPSWDLSELEQETFSNLEPVDGSSSFGDHHHHHHYRSIKGNFTVDLKLGQLGDSGNNELVNMLKEHGAPKATSSPSGTSKRSRAAYNGSQTVSCLVDGCNSDLSTCRDYHRRHKVCELHSKTPMVTINGQKQRFCQQCSRFHSLEEFDEGKRSCRKRLDGHNRRRRKPQPEPLMRSGSFLSSYQGTQLLPFSSSLVYPSTTVVNPTWAGVVKPEADTIGLHSQHLQHQNMFLGSSTSSSYNKAGGNKQQFALFQSRNNSQTISAHGASICQPLLNTISLSETASSAKSEMFCDRLTTSRIHPDSDCALSLLSSPQTQQQTSDLGLRHMVHRPNSISQMHHHHHHISGLQGNNNSSSVESMDSVLVSHGSSRDHANNVHPGMFHMGSDGSQGNHHHQGHQGPFHWG